ncbi:hypothetical protein MMC31_004517, partial [Peltigera leucophlebia]|nr:hypothetical protein [Peltigera leucophlebia]
MLLEKGANIEATNKKGRTPLHSAVIHGQVEIVQILLAKGANPEAAEGVPLYVAASMVHAPIVEMLLGAEKEVIFEW